MARASNHQVNVQSAATSSLAHQRRGTGARTKLTLNQERKSGLFPVSLPYPATRLDRPCLSISPQARSVYLSRSSKITRNPYLHCCLLITLRRTILALDRRKQIPRQHTNQAEVLTYQKNCRKKSHLFSSP